MTIGNNIKLCRNIKGFSQNDLANLSGISRVSIGNYERGDRSPNIDILKKIANGLNVNINTLINWSSNLCTHEDVLNFLYDILDSNEDSIIYKLSPILKEDDLFKISQFINLSYFNKNFYVCIADFIHLTENQLYNWILSIYIYNYNYMLSDYIIIYNELYDEHSEEKNFNISDLHKILVNEHNVPYYILDFLDFVTDNSFSRYKTFISFEDSKDLIINNVLTKEDLDKIISFGLSEHNNKIIFDFIVKKFNCYSSDNYNIDIQNNPVLILKSILTHSKNIKENNNKLEYLTDEQMSSVLDKVVDLVEYELYKIKKNN